MRDEDIMVMTEWLTDLNMDMLIKKEENICHKQKIHWLTEQDRAESWSCIKTLNIKLTWMKEVKIKVTTEWVSDLNLDTLNERH